MRDSYFQFINTHLTKKRLDKPVLVSTSKFVLLCFDAISRISKQIIFKFNISSIGHIEAVLINKTFLDHASMCTFLSVFTKNASIGYFEASLAVLCPLPP